MQALGGEWNAYTSNADTTFVIEAPAKNQRKVLDLLLALLTQTRFDDNAINAAKQVVEREDGGHYSTCSAGSTARTWATPPAINWRWNWASNARSAPKSTT
jgi:secreted Zn-dependent insulinase-like peptidase